MKLVSLTLNGFRGFPGEVSFNLDADAIVLVGANGSGKTSVFDAVLWALTGTVPRIGSSQDLVVSRYSTTGEARVNLGLERIDGSRWDITRRWDGSMNLAVGNGSESPLRGPSAEAYLLEQLWPDARLASDPQDALVRALTRGVYLQQDLLREFLDADDDQQRFRVIGEMIGMGRVAELQRQLESGKKSWTAATNVLAKETEPLQTRRAALAQRLARLTENAEEPVAALSAWKAWSKRVDELLSVATARRGGVPDPAHELDSMLRELQALELRDERRLSTAAQLLEYLRSPRPESAEIEPLREVLSNAEFAVVKARTDLEAAQEQAAANRRRQVEVREKSAELRTLAQIALRHIEGPCPVCGQEHEVEHTEARLHRLLAADSDSDQDQPSIDLAPLVAHVENAEQLATRASADLRLAEQARAASARWRETLDGLLRALDLRDEPLPDLEPRVTALISSLRETGAEVQALRRDGEVLGLRLARSSEVAQRTELARELETLEREVTQREQEVNARAVTGELAGEIINALREASSDVVAAELQRIEPLLQRVYATIDPHPAFRAVTFLTRTVRGHGRLWTSIEDRAANVSVEEPRTVLSSSQLNVLALSSFVALNLGVETLPLGLLALDDPLQSLDDVNLLGVVDLLRRIKSRRQILISTHDARFGDLLARKLRPVAEGERTRVIQLEGWTREGPIVSEGEIPLDPRKLRLVA